jgi:hypothetical protein
MTPAPSAQLAGEIHLQLELTTAGVTIPGDEVTIMMPSQTERIVNCHLSPCELSVFYMEEIVRILVNLTLPPNLGNNLTDQN